MMQKSFIKELTGIVGRDNVLSSRKDLLAYSYDSTARQEMPEVIVFPLSTAQVSQVIKAAHRDKVPVIARGAGTNLSGGTIPNRGGIVLELSRMNRILDIDLPNHRAVVQPGVVEKIMKVIAPIVEYERQGNLYMAEMTMSDFIRQGAAP